MTDPVVVVVPSSSDIDTIEPDPEIQPVVHNCEPLNPEPELEMIPLPKEKAIPPIGGGVSPIVEEKESNNNEADKNGEETTAETEEQTKKRPEPEEEPKVSVEPEEKLEETTVPEESAKEAETQTTQPMEQKEGLLKKLLESEEFQAMATLMESAITTATRQLQPVTDKMYEKKYPLLENILDRLEHASGIKREKLVYGAATFLVVYFLVGSLIQITCNLVGFVYPAWRSIRAVRSPEKDDDTQWLIYWVVFASLSVVDFSVFSAIPFYWLAKVVFLLYLYLPTFKGANTVYDKYIEPSCTVIESYFTPIEKKQN